MQVNPFESHLLEFNKIIILHRYNTCWSLYSCFLNPSWNLIRKQRRLHDVMQRKMQRLTYRPTTFRFDFEVHAKMISLHGRADLSIWFSYRNYEASQQITTITNELYDPFDTCNLAFIRPSHHSLANATALRSLPSRHSRGAGERDFFSSVLPWTQSFIVKLDLIYWLYRCLSWFPGAVRPGPPGPGRASDSFVTGKLSYPPAVVKCFKCFKASYWCYKWDEL